MDHNHNQPSAPNAAETKHDYFLASLEGEELIMEPYCQCGEMLNQEYFCPQCNRNCVCLEIRCKNEKTIERVFELVKANPSFSKFHPILMEE